MFSVDFGGTMTFSDDGSAKNVFYDSASLKAQVMCLRAGRVTPPCTMSNDVLFCVLRGEGEMIVDDERARFKAVDERGGSPTGGIPQHRRRNRSGDSGRSVGERPLNGEGCAAFRGRCEAVAAALSVIKPAWVQTQVVFPQETLTQEVSSSCVRL